MGKGDGMARPSIKAYENYPTQDEKNPKIPNTFGFGTEFVVLIIDDIEVHVDPEMGTVYIEGKRPWDGWLPVPLTHPVTLVALKIVDTSRLVF